MSSTFRPIITFECRSSFRVSVLSEGRVAIEAEDVTLPEELIHESQADSMTPGEVAKMWGTSLRNVYNWMSKEQNPLPHFRPPHGKKGETRISHKQAEKWVKDGACVTTRRLRHNVYGDEGVDVDAAHLESAADTILEERAEQVVAEMAAEEPTAPDGNWTPPTEDDELPAVELTP